MTKADRTYGQCCPIAAGLDVAGRPLGAADLPRAADGRPALHRPARRAPRHRPQPADRAPPGPPGRRARRAPSSCRRRRPAPSTDLTDEGRASSPVLRAMARFGVHFLDDEPGAPLDARRAAHALLLPWRRSVDGRPPRPARCGPGRRDRRRARRHRHGDRRGRGRRRRDARGHPRRSRPGPPGRRAAGRDDHRRPPSAAPAARGLQPPARWRADGRRRPTMPMSSRHTCVVSSAMTSVTARLGEAVTVGRDARRAAGAGVVDAARS